VQQAKVAQQEYQSAEFLRLFETYTADPNSIGAKLNNAALHNGRDAPLIVATGADFVLYPGGGQEPEVEGYRLTTRGFKELSAVSHFGPAVASLVKIRELDPDSAVWRVEAERLLAATEAARAVNSPTLWRDVIAVPAYRGRETTIANMVHYACEVTETYLKRGLASPDTFTAEDMRRQYLEASGSLPGAVVPVNKMMIATFFLVGMDTAHRVISWFDRRTIDWEQAMVLIVGRQGRPTAGVTLATNAVAAMIQGASRHRLPLERLYIAPHAPPFNVSRPVDLGEIHAQEAPMRKLWWYTRAMSDLGPMMYQDYPSFVPNKNNRPVLDVNTTEVSEMPHISGPEDWRALNTRMRLILEDPRQLLAGCVIDYAVDLLQAHDNQPERLVVPGLDGVDYPKYFD
jgi:hypothetical protein